MSKSDVKILGDSLGTILTAAKDLCLQEKMTGKQIVVTMLRENDPKNAAQFAVYDAVNSTSWCPDCQAWHVSLESLDSTIECLTQLYSETVEKRSEILLKNKNILAYTLVSYLDYILEAGEVLTAYLAEATENANSTKVLH